VLDFVVIADYTIVGDEPLKSKGERLSKKIDYDALSRNDQKLLADKLCQEQKTGTYDGLVELFQFYLKIFLVVARKIANGFGIQSDEHILDYVYDFRLEFLKGKIRNNEPKYIICGFRGDSELYVYITGALRYCLIKKLVKKIKYYTITGS